MTDDPGASCGCLLVLCLLAVAAVLVYFVVLVTTGRVL